MLKKEINKIHLLFEQSGHFKNVFKSIGINAYDYDILNEYNETDFVIDLFSEIEKAYNNEKSIFDCFDEQDLIFAFFPCIRFSQYGSMQSLCNTKQTITLNNLDKVKFSMNFNNEISYFYKKFCKLYIVCLKRNLKVIIENPIDEQHYLKRYFPIKPKIIIYDRHAHGDYFVKPTQFYFINLEPCYNFIHYLPYISNKKNIHLTKKGSERSLISTEFIKWFIQDYIIEDINFNEV